jgi:uncharacterized LabA/DUF88 family protein
VADSDRLRIAVFIDFDNIEIGVKSTLGASFDAGLVLEALRERGEVVSKTAYSDWQRAGGYSRMLTQHAIRMVQRNMTPGGDKNGADINLALDALEMAFTHPHINAFVIVGGDSDFISLVEKLKQYDKKVFIVGGRQFTSGIMQRNCHEFMAYENLIGATAPHPSSGGGRRHEARGVRVERVPIDQAIPLVSRALKVLQEREVSPQLGLLKSTLLQLDSTFSERSYGAGSFRDFIAKLEKIGIVTVHQGKGGLLVDPVEGAVPAGEPAAAPEDADTAEAGQAAESPARGTAHHAAPHGVAGPAPAVTGSAAEGLREFRQILASAEIRKWPMYLRNVKQVIRQTSPSFDERAYGFGNLTDLLRAAHKDGIVRVDRDRQGVIRVFQGSVGAAPADAATRRDSYAPVEPDDVDDVVEAEESTGVEDVSVAAAASEMGVPLAVPVDDQDVEAPEIIDVPADEVAETTAAPVRKPRARGSRGRGRTAQTGDRPSSPASRARRPRKER